MKRTHRLAVAPQEIGEDALWRRFGVFCSACVMKKPRANLPHDVQLPSPWNSGSQGFIGAWDILDDGDVPPRAMIRGDNTFLVHPAGVTINPKAGEVFATDSVRNGLFTFLAPRWFPQRPQTTR